MGNEAVAAVRDFLKADKACEKQLADQLLLPLNVFVGGWFDPGEDCHCEKVKQAENLAKHPVVFDHVALMPSGYPGRPGPAPLSKFAIIRKTI